MAAGLECDVGRRSASAAAGLGKGHDLGVRPTGLAMVTATDDAPPSYEDTANRGIRRRPAQTLSRLLARDIHPAFVTIHREPPRPRSFTSVSSALMNSSMSRNDLYTDAKRT